MPTWVWWVAGGIVVLVILAGVFLRRGRGRKALATPLAVLEAGWQLCHRPTELDVPGSVFRIDRQGRRYRVDQLPVDVTIAEEASGTVRTRLQASLSALAAALSLPVGGGGGVNRSETLEVELENPQREVTTDANVDRVLKPFLDELDMREGNWYYLVREARTATRMTYRLSEKQVSALRGNLDAAQLAQVDVTAARRTDDAYELSAPFSKRLRVAFLPEEIKVVRRELGGKPGELGRLPVRGPLEYQDAEESR